MFRRRHRAAATPNTANTSNPSHANNIATNAGPPCHTCRRPILPGERHLRTIRTISGDRRYHHGCFLCFHCREPIDLGQNFCYARLDNEEGGGDINMDDDTGGETVGGDRVRAAAGEEGSHTEHPFHRSCFAQHFGWVCVVCDSPLPMVLRARRSDDTHDKRTTRVEFYKHPFFEEEKMCPCHVRPTLGDSRGDVANANLNEGQNNNSRSGNPHEDNDGNGWEDGRLVERSSATSITTTTRTEDALGEVRRCAGCHRFEPISHSKRFVDVGDGNTGRCVCLACCRTVVTSNDDAIPLWKRVVDFFEGPLGLISGDNSGGGGHAFGGVTRRDLERIPILVVGAAALNDNMKRHAHTGHLESAQIMTRGLCLSERMRGGSKRSSKGGEAEVGVTAILCLSGLPSALAASILAHEAMHAWIKMHPNFPCADPLPLRVEEGICQLVAFLFLNDGLDPPVPGPDEVEESTMPSEERLRQYFRFCIETDEGAYGEGFRGAARAYARMGMQELLYHVAVHRGFPPLPPSIGERQSSF